MTEYTTLRNTDLQKLLADRNLSVTGSKVTMIERLQDDDAAKKRSLPLRNPDGAAEDLRRSVHHENLDKRWFQPRKERPSMSRRLAIQRRLNKGKCMEPSCCLCGTGTLSEATEALFGRSSECTDGTCWALRDCHKCRSGLEKPNEAYIRRDQDSCTDASCGNLSKCFRCETCIRDAIIPTDLPERLRRPFDPRKNPDRELETKHMVAELRRCVHNRHLRKLILKLRVEVPDTAEWNAIKQKLLEGKCLGLVCCLCGTATLAESMQTLSDGPNIDCGGRLPASCKDQDQCSSCRQIMQEVADDITREEPNYFTHRDQIQRLASIKRAAKNSIPDEVVGVERHCLDEDCGGIGTCGACKWVKYEQKMKRAGTGAWCENRGPRRPKQRGLSYWLSLTSASDRGHDSIDRPRCGIIDAITGPQMRNEDLRRRRASKILTGNPESYEGPASGVARKRRFSNLGLEYPLPSRHPLAQYIRDEEKREELERARAQTHHERPSWFGSEKDPLPDFWQGRPILSEKEISILKCLPSIPKYYLSESEDNDILLPEGAKEKRLCTVIRRLEAELMSRDFWMQSLGYNAADAFGKFPSGHYVVAGTDSLS